MTAARVASVAIAISCGAVAIYLQLGAQDAQRVRKANDLAAHGRFDAALATAREVTRSPADLKAKLVEARTLALAGRVREASREYAEIARRDPNNWIVHWEWARVTFREEPGEALRRLKRAKELNPLLPVLDSPAPED